MIIQTTDKHLLEIAIIDEPTGVDIAVDMMQFSRILHLNDEETAYVWPDIAASVYEEIEYWKNEGYICHVHVIS